MIQDSIDITGVNSNLGQVAVGLRSDGHAKAGLSRLGAVAALLFASLLLAGPATTQVVKVATVNLRTITTVGGAHRLSSKEAARGYPVHLRAVVTYFDPNIGHPNANLFVHDATGSIYIYDAQGLIRSLPVGALIDLRGVSGPGQFAPVVEQPQIKVIGHSGLPGNPSRPSFAALMSGTTDGEWVEVEGIVHSTVEDDHHVGLQLTLSDGNITAVMVKEAGVDYSRLVDAKVRVRAHQCPLYDSVRKQMIGVRLMCPNLSAIQVLQPPPKDPFKLPMIPISRLLQWDMVPLLAHRVHVQGRVTMQWPGASVCIREAEQGICAQTDQRSHLANGELIDIVGFAKSEGSAPVLTDAIFSRADGSPAAPVTAAPVTANDAQRGGHEFQLVQIDGQLLSRDLASADTTLLLSSGKYIFKAILPRGMAGPEADAWEDGSLLRITGICSVQLNVQGNALALGTAVPSSFQVLMRSPADVVVLQRPSWWTPTHALVLLALAFCATLLVLAWVVVLRRRVERQAILLRESEQRFRHMALHDALTGLATRLLLEDRLNAALVTAKRHKAGLALLMVDLDKFKETNDTFGHQAGDEVLRVTADRLLEAVRKSDTVARMGGDEFIVLLPDLRDPQIAERIAANIVETLAAPIFFEGRVLPVSVSVGVCSAAAAELDADALLKNVDAALYHAKEHGRNRFEVFTPDLAGTQTEG